MSLPLSGWLILDKPRGLGSTEGVSAVKRVLRQNGYAKTKVGHGGTLDPLAEGVLPIALGEATKLAGRMLDASKIYEFTIAFGAETTTLDTEGAVAATSADRKSRLSAVGSFMGWGSAPASAGGKFPRSLSHQAQFPEMVAVSASFHHG